MPAPIETFREADLSETLSGAQGVVDLWCCRIESVSERALQDACAGVISDAEDEKRRALQFERDRILYLTSRLLLRTALSSYAGVPRGEWRFRADDHGKPRIADPHVSPTLYFNLAHTYGLAACVVCVAHDQVGVDVERLDRETSYASVAENTFSRPDVTAMAALPPHDRPRRFFELWTLRESYAKALGLGLAFPFDQISFSFGDPINATFDAAADDLADSWRFATISAAPSHLAAVAVRTGGAPLSLRVRIVSMDVLTRPEV